jgi:parallel beta-helix repeat protein
MRQISGIADRFCSRRSLKNALRIAVCVLAAASSVWGQATIHVPKEQPTIQGGINAAQNGDTVLVAPGAYKEAIDFKGKAITVTSSGGAASTIIDGINQSFVVTFQSNEGRSSMLSGFTIQNGGAPQMQNPPNPYYETGGIAVFGAAPTISNNTITHNLCTGIFSAGGGPLIQNNEISYTTSPPKPTAITGQCFANPYNNDFWGASAVYFATVIAQGAPQSALPAVVSGNTIENNTLTDGDANDDCGPALYGSISTGAPLVVENNVIRNNNTDTTGGGVCIWGPGIFAQNLVYGNHAHCAGGGATAANGPPTYGPITFLLANNLFAGNSSDYQQCNSPNGSAEPYDPNPDGSQVKIYGPSQMEFANNVVVGNDSHSAIYVDNPGSVPQLAYIVFDHNDLYNSGGPAYGTGGVTMAGAIRDPTGTFGNISADPQFRDAAGNDYHPLAGSPLIDAGNTSALQQLNLLGFPLTTDFDGNPRVTDATGKGYPIVDIGPYEFSGAQDANPTTLLVTPSNYMPFGGQTITLTANTYSNAGIPVGKVTFYLDGTSLGAVELDSTGAATVQTPGLSRGQHTLYATYPGQSGYPPAIAVEVIIWVQAYQSQMTLTSSENPNVVIQPITITAHLTSLDGPPTGNVAFSEPATGANFGGAAIDSNGNAAVTITGLTVGQHKIFAYYGGNDNWFDSSATITQTVLQIFPDQETLTATPATSLVGQQVTFTATVTSPYSGPPYGTLSGNIAFTNGTTTLGAIPLNTNGIATLASSTLPRGTYTVTASYPGTSLYAPASTSVNIQVIGVDTTTIIRSVTPSPLYALQTASIAASITAKNGGAPSGSLAFFNGATPIGSAPLANNAATLAYAFPAAGNASLTAQYPGDNTFNSSTSAPYPVNALINSSSTALTVAPAAPVAFQPITLSAAVSSATASRFGVAPNGSVTFLSGANPIGSATLNAPGAATLTVSTLQAGAYTLSASYPGTSAFQPSSSNPITLTVAPDPTTTSLASNVNPQQVGSPVTFAVKVTAVGTPAGTITLLDNGQPIASAPLDSTGAAAITLSTLAIGTHPITASYSPANGNFLPSASSVLNQVIVLALGDFSIAVTPASQSIYTGEAAGFSVVLSPSNGWNRDVTLTCTGLPANTTCAFTPATVPGGKGTATLSIQTAAPRQTSTLVPTGPGTAIALCFLILLPFTGPRKPFRRYFALFALAAVVSAISACGANAASGGTTPGTYTINVTGTFAADGQSISRSATVTLTVKSLF